MFWGNAFIYKKFSHLFMAKKKKKLIIDQKSDIVVHEDYVEEEDSVEIDEE